MEQNTLLQSIFKTGVDGKKYHSSANLIYPAYILNKDLFPSVAGTKFTRVIGLSNQNYNKFTAKHQLNLDMASKNDQEDTEKLIGQKSGKGYRTLYFEHNFLPKFTTYKYNKLILVTDNDYTRELAEGLNPVSYFQSEIDYCHVVDGEAIAYTKWFTPAVMDDDTETNLTKQSCHHNFS